MVSPFLRGRSLAALILLTSVGHTQVAIPGRLPNAIDNVRDSMDYRFLTSLFPEGGPTFDPDRQPVMTDQQKAAGAEYLGIEFEALKKVFGRQMASVLRGLEEFGVRSPRIISTKPTRIDFRDDQQAWSNTISPTEIVIGARVLRGLVLGSLRESTAGKSLFSQSLAAYLGAGGGGHESAGELESRARLFFAAGLRGRSEMREDQDFEEHVRLQVALADKLKENGGGAAVHAELERRLRTAAAGGAITGADGMAMFDVFMDLNSHFRPAMVFVLAHELGHAVLGNAPFPAGLSCRDKQKREDDADAFAVSLLAYEVPGDLEVGHVALAAIAGKAADPAEDSLEYGYAHAIRYGFAMAGLNNTIGDPDCGYRNVEDRVRYLDGLRRTLIGIRGAATEKAYRFFIAHPPYVYTDDDVSELAPAEQRTLARKLFERCRSGLPAPSVRLIQLHGLDYGWVVACPNRLAPDLSTPDFRTRLGTETNKQFAAEYRRRQPTLLTGEEIKALQAFSSQP